MVKKNQFVSDDHLNNLKDMQKQILRNEIFPDVKLVFSGGDFILAHKAILSINSSFFKECFKDLPTTLENLTVLILPDINKSIMKKVLNFLYTGEVILNSNELNDFFDNKSFLGIDIDTFDCKSKNERKRKSTEETESSEILADAEDTELPKLESDRKAEFIKQFKNVSLTPKNVFFDIEADTFDCIIPSKNEQKRKSTEEIEIFEVFTDIEDTESLKTEPDRKTQVIKQYKSAKFTSNKTILGIKTDALDCIVQSENKQKRKSTEGIEILEISPDFEYTESPKTEPDRKTKFFKQFKSAKVTPKEVLQKISVNNSEETKIVNYKLHPPIDFVCEDTITTTISNLETDEFSEEENINKKPLDCYGYTLKNPNCLKPEEIEIDEADYGTIQSDESELLKISKKNIEKQAIKEILECGVSVSRASKIYKISKSQLWLRVKNDPRYKINVGLSSFDAKMKEEALSQICERLKMGQNLQTISNALGMPVSTIHWYKVRLCKNGLLPETLPQIRRTLRTDEKQRKNLEKAIEACKNGMIQNKAATKFGVSKATLCRRMKVLNQAINSSS